MIINRLFRVCAYSSFHHHLIELNSFKLTVDFVQVLFFFDKPESVGQLPFHVRLSNIMEGSTKPIHDQRRLDSLKVKYKQSSSSLSSEPSSSNHDLIMSSDLSSSICRLHPRFYASNLVSSVCQNLIFTNVSSLRRHHSLKSSPASVVAHLTLIDECQCLQPISAEIPLSATQHLSQESCTSILDDDGIRESSHKMTNTISSSSSSPLHATTLALDRTSPFSSSWQTLATTQQLSNSVTNVKNVSIVFNEHLQRRRRKPNNRMNCGIVSSSIKTVKSGYLGSSPLNLISTLLLIVIAMCNLLPSCDTQAVPYSVYADIPHHRYPRIDAIAEAAEHAAMVSSINATVATIDTLPSNDPIRPSRTMTLEQQRRQVQANRYIRQPAINQLHFCAEPPLVSNAQSSLHRNQKHRVFPLGQVVTYMCKQGYAAVGGNAETKCTNPEPHQAVSSGSHVIFPDFNDKADSESPDHVVLLGSGRTKNSKRLMTDLDEDHDLNNGNRHRMIGGNHLIFPGNYDKRKMSRKSDDELIGSIYDSTITANMDGRNSDLENDSEEHLERRKQKMEKNIRTLGPSWWPPVTLNCQQVNCSDPGQVPNAKRLEPNGTFTFNSNVQYQCDKGYETIGIPILTCKANGSWNRNPPQCRLMQCPELPTLADGRITYSNNRLSDSRAEYSCNNGYRLNAMLNNRYCRHDNQWSPLEPLPNTNVTDPYRCLPIQCPAPIRPHVGLRILNVLKKKVFVPDDVIIYICDAIKIKQTAKCRPDGEWSREPPECPEINPNCPSLPLFPHGVFNVEKNKANFSCFDGYQLDGVSSITCLSKGVWSAPMPRCVLNLVNHKLPHSKENGNKTIVRPHVDETKESEIANLEEQQKTTSNKLTVLFVVIVIVVFTIIGIVTWFLCRNRRDKQQRKKWQKYFGHYHHRQSKTNIVMNATNNHFLSGPMGTAGSTGAGPATANTTSLNAATRHLLEHRPRTNTNAGSANRQPNFLQSSFSSSDNDNNELKSYTGTGTMCSDHARTVSSYADDTCPEDEDDDDDFYSNASMLRRKAGASATVTSPSKHPVAAARRPVSGLTELNTSEPMILLLNGNGQTSSSTSTSATIGEHTYSNVPQSSSQTSSSSTGASSPFTATVFSTPIQKSNVPVTEL